MTFLNTGALLSYYYFRFLKTNVHYIGILLPVSIFTFASSSACHSARGYQISCKSYRLRWSYSVISVFQDGGHNITILLSVSFFMTLLIREGRNLPADQISATYLNPGLRYYYFRFLKTNVRHVGILLPVLISTFASSSACHDILHLPTKFCPNRTVHAGYEVIAIFKMAAVSHIKFSQR